MSPNIWMQCGGTANRKSLEEKIYRLVEAQHKNSTRKLVDKDKEQERLEDLLERVKPPYPPWPATASRPHYLLATPFRYPPLRHGSRFGKKTQRGIWYGSLQIPTALAEIAYYRFVFASGSRAELLPFHDEHTAFPTTIRTPAGVDLTQPPFSSYRQHISSPDNYTHSQALGTAMRQDQVEAFVYVSARCPEGGKNVGLFEPAFEKPTISSSSFQTWRCSVAPNRVEFQRINQARSNVPIVFEKKIFEINGRLPTPAI